MAIKSEFENPRILELLEVQPQMLQAYGLDINKVKSELERVKQARENIEKNYDENVGQSDDLWMEWIKKYKKILSKQK